MKTVSPGRCACFFLRKSGFLGDIFFLEKPGGSLKEEGKGR